MTRQDPPSEAPRPQPLKRKRILVCGKGGSGKSTLVAMIAAALKRRGYQIVVLDGDASNPEGLVRLLFGGGVEDEPKPLIEFFGGIDQVTCPVDDPSPLTRVGDSDQIPQRRIDLAAEIDSRYYLQDGNLHLLQAGKIETYGQGCDGPIEKVVRDFMIAGDFVSLIDEKAGVEHFGRRIPDRMDMILGVLDCTRESVSIAQRISGFSKSTGIDSVWFVLNKTESQAMVDQMMGLLGQLSGKIVGSIPYYPELVSAALAGYPLEQAMNMDAVGRIVRRLEDIALQRDGRRSGRVA
jgi:CO dehydrogenase maturation factor